MRNDTKIDKAFADFEKEIHNEVRVKLKSWCSQLIKKAVEMRLGDMRAHNFTGNLLNSIVVCLYESRKPIDVWYAADEPNVHSAIHVKMTARNKPYGFKNGDYDGRPSHYQATVRTDGGWGIDDAKLFFQSYRPQGNRMFDVVICYAVEYAEWVQAQRNTTGYLEMIGFTTHSAREFMNPSATG